MSEIPEDIREIARDIAGWIETALLAERMKERERCAELADGLADDWVGREWWWRMHCHRQSHKEREMSVEDYGRLGMAEAEAMRKIDNAESPDECIDIAIEALDRGLFGGMDSTVSLSRDAKTIIKYALKRALKLSLKEKPATD